MFVIHKQHMLVHSLMFIWR